MVPGHSGSILASPATKESFKFFIACKRIRIRPIRAAPGRLTQAVQGPPPGAHWPDPVHRRARACSRQAHAWPLTQLLNCTARVSKGKKSPVDQLDILESLSILLESGMVTDTTPVRFIQYMQNMQKDICNICNICNILHIRYMQNMQNMQKI